MRDSADAHGRAWKEDPGYPGRTTELLEYRFLLSHIHNKLTAYDSRDDVIIDCTELPKRSANDLSSHCITEGTGVEPRNIYLCFSNGMVFQSQLPITPDALSAVTISCSEAVSNDFNNKIKTPGSCRDF